MWYYSEVKRMSMKIQSKDNNMYDTVQNANSSTGAVF